MSRDGTTQSKPTRADFVRFVQAFRYAVEREYGDGQEPPLWIRNGYDDARELLGLDPSSWPAPWERADA